MLRKVLAGAVMAGALFSWAPMASARDICAGAYELDGCEFCSYQGSFQGSPPSYCDAGYSGYYWARCTTWVYDYCIEGVAAN